MHYWVIDRIENGIAVLINTDTQETQDRPKKELPNGAKEGQLLSIDGGGAMKIDHEETAAQVARLQERLDRLKK
jgi:hypothetical protein